MHSLAAAPPPKMLVLFLLTSIGFFAVLAVMGLVKELLVAL